MTVHLKSLHAAFLNLTVIIVIMLPRIALSAEPLAVVIKTSMEIDVDGAPNAYGPREKETLDFELNAHVGGKPDGEIVGYMTEKDGRTPVTQGANDPFPGYYISTTGFSDMNNPNEHDPKKYVDAARVNYVVISRVAEKSGVSLGDFVSIYSKKTRKSVYGIVGDSGNPAGSEGSLALLQALGYPVKNGKSGGVDNKEIVIRYFPGSNPDHHFYATQAEIDSHAKSLGLSKEFSANN